jgi:hypothetical protein
MNTYKKDGSNRPAIGKWIAMVLIAVGALMAPLAWIIHDLSGEKRKDALKG